MRVLLRLFKTTSFVVALCLMLATTAVSATVWAMSMTTQVATMTASAAATAIAHRKAIAAAVLRAKAKARMRRVMVAVPLAGIAAASYFEHQDYIEWKEDNPEGSPSDYGCEVSAVSAELVDEVLQELPEAVRPKPQSILSKMPSCSETGSKLAAVTQ